MCTNHISLLLGGLNHKWLTKLLHHFWLSEVQFECSITSSALLWIFCSWRWNDIHIEYWICWTRVSRTQEARDWTTLFQVHIVWIIVVIFGSFIWNAREGLIWWWWLVKNASQAIEKASKVCRVCPPPSTPSKPPCPEGKSAGERWVLLVLLMDTKSQMESPFQELFSRLQYLTWKRWKHSDATLS